MGWDAAKLDYKKTSWDICQYRVFAWLRVQVRGGSFPKAWGWGLTIRQALQMQSLQRQSRIQVVWTGRASQFESPDILIPSWERE